MAYEKHTWVCGETITADKMNHIEDGIAEGGGGDALIVHFANDDQSDPNSTWSCDTEIADIRNALSAGKPVIGVATFTLNGQANIIQTVPVSFYSGSYEAYIKSARLWKGENDSLPPTRWTMSWQG